MPKLVSSAIGIDLGRYSYKAVHLHRRGANRLALTAFASRTVGEGDSQSPDRFAHHLKLLLRDLGASGSKNCAIAVSSPRALLRIIEQPDTPVLLLRHALRLQGLHLLNQDCRDFVLDCDLVHAQTNEESDARGGDSVRRRRYLVGGLPRVEVDQIHDTLAKNRLSADVLQLAPISSFNAFGYAMHENEDHRREAYLLADIGHEETRVLIGLGRELVLVRSIDYGGRHFLDAVTDGGAIDRDAAITLIEQGDAGMAEAGRHSLSVLAHELRSSIGFFEGQREQVIRRVYFAGGLVKAEMPLQILSDELEMPCGTWDPFVQYEIALPKNKQMFFNSERAQFHVACGAALELLLPR